MKSGAFATLCAATVFTLGGTAIAVAKPPHGGGHGPGIVHSGGRPHAGPPIHVGPRLHAGPRVHIAPRYYARPSWGWDAPAYYGVYSTYPIASDCSYYRTMWRRTGRKIWKLRYLECLDD